jgi:hypothetical protein
VRYRIEYLMQTAEGDTVCQTAEAEGNLELAELQARLNGENMRRAFDAGGFQIRDLEDGGRIVALESFEDPLARFWPHASDHVIH